MEPVMRVQGITEGLKKGYEATNTKEKQPTTDTSQLVSRSFKE